MGVPRVAGEAGAQSVQRDDGAADRRSGFSVAGVRVLRPGHDQYGRIRGHHARHLRRDRSRAHLHPAGRVVLWIRHLERLGGIANVEDQRHGSGRDARKDARRRGLDEAQWLPQEDQAGGPALFQHELRAFERCRAGEPILRRAASLVAGQSAQVHHEQLRGPRAVCRDPPASAVPDRQVGRQGDRLHCSALSSPCRGAALQQRR